MYLRTILACSAVVGLLTACNPPPREADQAQQDTQEAETKAIEDISEANEQESPQGETDRESTGQSEPVQVTPEICAQLAQEREIKPENRHLYEACAELERQQGGN